MGTGAALGSLAGGAYGSTIGALGAFGGPLGMIGGAILGSLFD
jgi:hypothetical protein